MLYCPDKFPVLLFRSLPVSATAPDDGWCDDPGHPLYNQPVRLPFPVSHEKMWREDDLYDLFVVVGYNDDSLIPGQGNAIFLHVAREGYAPRWGASPSMSCRCEGLI
ncbi:hypothetical protein DFAR_2770028 [Desulfarculales bacterium]